jgi:hypothetical protein
LKQFLAFKLLSRNTESQTLNAPTKHNQLFIKHLRSKNE